MLKSKKLFITLFSVIVLMPMFNLIASADTYGIYNYTVRDSNATITGITKLLTSSLIIPDKINNYPVTSIGAGAFSGYTALTSVTIPDSVTSIGDNAFYNCVALANVTMPSGLTSIGHFAFGYCEKLENIILPKGVTTIFGYAFYHCSALTNLTIPPNVTTIGECAFADCTSLSEISIPYSVNSIGWGAFSNCTNLSSATLSSCITSISYEMFKNCSSLTNIYIPKTITSISDLAFLNCSGLTNVTVPESVITIGNGAFEGCSGLMEITLPFVGKDASLNETFEAVFGFIFGISGSVPNSLEDTQQMFSPTSQYYYRIPKSLKKVTITNATQIPYGAFYGCKNLTSISIPNGVTSIGGCAFALCTGITSITVPSGITAINDKTFYCCFRLTDITIPNGVTTIGNEVFNGCCDLTRITVPDSVTSISGGAFYNCVSLEEITLPFVGTEENSVGTYHSVFGSVFGTYQSYEPETVLQKYGPNPEQETYYFIPASLKKVTITKATKIPYGAFYNCSNMSITLPSTVTNIGTYAIYGCSGVTNITVSDNTKIDKDAFVNCSPFLTLMVKNKTGTVTDNFCEYNQISKIVIDNGITSIGDKAFNNCGSLTAVYIPDTVVDTGYEAFEGTAWLSNNPAEFVTVGQGVLVRWKGSSQSAEIPSTVKTIAAGAFENCTSLTSLEIPSFINEIKKLTFYGCTSLQSIKIPVSVTSIGEYAFFNCPYLTINGYTGSAAQTYAAQNYITFNSIGDSAAVPLTNTTVSKIGSKYVFKIDSNISFTNQFVHMSFYDSTNKLVDYMILPVTELSNKFYVVLNYNPAATYAKIFVWNSIDIMEPASGAETVNFAM